MDCRARKEKVRHMHPAARSIVPAPSRRSRLLLGFALIGLVALAGACKKTKPKAPPICDVNTTTCSSTLQDGTTVRFAVQPRPVRSMALLTYEVEVTGGPAGATAVSLDFKMPAMYMGENKVALKASEAGPFVGTGTIVKCPSGDRLWDVAVRLERPGQPDAIVHFRFDVDR